MKAITLWQPHASLIASNAKPYETRTWSPPDSMIGKRIAIHAAKRKITGFEYSIYCKYREQQDIDKEIRKSIPNPLNLDLSDIDWRIFLPYGKIVARAKLNAVYKVNDQLVDGDILCSGACRKLNGKIAHFKNLIIETDQFGNYSVGRYLWELTDIEKLDTPIPAIGRQGIWNWGE